MEKKTMSEDSATPQQIRKLYAVVRNAGMNPKDYVENLKKETGLDSLKQFKKNTISELIDEFENSERERDSVEKETDVVNDLEACLNEIDTIFCACITRARKTISKKFAKIEEIPDTTILNLAMFYFGEVKRAERS